MSTKMYLKSDKVTLRFPVLPEKIEIKDSANHKSVSIGNTGEIFLKQGRKAQEISFSSFFPNTSFQGSINTVKKPSWYVKKIENFIKNRKTVRFVLSRDSSRYVGFSTKVLVTDFTYYEEGGDVGTIQYSITLKEYRKVSANKITKKKKKKSSSKRTGKDKVSTYTVKKGDTIQNIAKKTLGSSSKWKSIYKANKTVIEKAAKKHGKKSSQQGHYLYKGTVLKIPNS